MGFLDDHGVYHEKPGARMRHKITGAICKLEREAEVNGKVVYVCREVNANVVLAGVIGDFEALDGEEVEAPCA